MKERFFPLQCLKKMELACRVKRQNKGTKETTYHINHINHIFVIGARKKKELKRQSKKRKTLNHSRRVLTSQLASTICWLSWMPCKWSSATSKKSVHVLIKYFILIVYITWKSNLYLCMSFKLIFIVDVSKFHWT